MKTKTFKLMATLFVAALSLGFTSCGDDENNDEPKKPEKEEATIVGSWKVNFSNDHYEICTFYPDGTMQTYVWNWEPEEDGEYIIRSLYSFDKDNMRLTITDVEEEDPSGRRVYDVDERETGTCTVIELSSERLIIQNGDKGFATFVPYKGNVITSLYKN